MISADPGQDRATKTGESLKESDRKLIDAIRSGDPGAFEELYETYFRRVFNFSVRKIGDPTEAEDVCQDVFSAVFTCLDRFQGRSDLVVWIYGITRNILNNRLRRRGALRLISLEDVPPEAAPLDLGPEPRAEARESLARVEAAIRELPTDQRRILELRHSRRLAIRRIAELMNRSEDAIKSSLYRTRRTLASKLPDRDPRPSVC